MKGMAYLMSGMSIRLCWVEEELQCQAVSCTSHDVRPFACVVCGGWKGSDVRQRVFLMHVHSSLLFVVG